MKLIQLRLENFRQHANSCVDFRDGMTAIVGSNGSGKTTLLEAITYALYGAQRDNKDTIRFFWNDKKKFSAALTFEFDRKRYLCERTNTDARLVEITKGQRICATGQVEVRRACEKILSLTYDQFKNSFCAEQKELEFLNFKNHAERQEEVARMLGFYRLKEAEELAKERRSTMRANAEGIERALGSLEEMTQDKKTAVAAVDTIVKQRKDAEKRLAELTKQLPASTEAAERGQRYLDLSAQMGEIGGKAEGLKGSVKLANEALAEAEKAAQELQPLKAVAAQYQELESKLKAMDAAYEADRKREHLAKELENLTRASQEAEAQIKQINAPDLAKVLTHLEEAVRADKEAQAAIKEQEKKWQEAKLAAQTQVTEARAASEQAAESLRKYEENLKLGRCPECGQEFAGDFMKGLEAQRKSAAERAKLHVASQAQWDKLAATPPELAKAVEKHNTTAEALKKQQTEAEKSHALATQAKTLSDQQKGREARQKELTAELTKLPSAYDPKAHQATREALETLKPKHRRFLELSQSEAQLATRKAAAVAAQAQLEEARSKYRELDAQRSALKFENPAAAQSSVESHRTLQRDIGATKIEIDGHDKHFATAEKAVNQAAKRIEEHDRRAKDLKELKERANLHDSAAKEMRNLRERLNKSIRPALVARSSDILAELTSGRYNRLDLDRNFQPILMEDDMPKPVISGGEEDVVALALRIALSELIQERQGHPLSLLILDEVFGSLDAERRQSVLSQLSAIKPRFAQIFVISHIDEINQVADQCLFIDRDPESRASVVRDGAGMGFGGLGL